MAKKKKKRSKAATLKLEPLKKIRVPTFKYTRRVMGKEITLAVKKLVRLIAKREPYFRGARKCAISGIRIELERIHGPKKHPKQDRATVITDHRQVQEAVWWKARMNPKSPKKLTNMIL